MPMRGLSDRTCTAIDRRIASSEVARQLQWGCGVRNRWMILAVLFVVRLTMAFQFQSVAAIAPLLGTQFGVSLADIGVLIGLYLTPAIALALPAGPTGQRFGDNRPVLAALFLILLAN